MKIDLIKLKFNDTCAYKYKPFTYCCDEIQNDKAIVFTGEDLVCNDTFVLHILKHLILGETSTNRQTIIQSSFVLIAERRLRFLLQRRLMYRINTMN